MTAWLTRPCTGKRYLQVWRGLATVIALRCALGPYRELAGQPAALFRPVPFLRSLHHMPGTTAIAAVQVVGVVAAIIAIVRPRTWWALLVAWASLLVLAGLKTSLGKILHNDLLLIFATVPFLLTPAGDAEGEQSSPRFGLPVQTATAVVALVYFIIGLQKLRHSGLAWVTSDNIRWVLYGGATSGNPPSPAPARFLADQAWATHVIAAGTLGIELGFPLVLLSDRVKRTWAVLAVGLHAATWGLLGLDYWAWAAVDLIVLIDWTTTARMIAAWRSGNPTRYASSRKRSEDVSIASDGSLPGRRPLSRRMTS